jgi:hypothetical protein
MLVFTNGSAGFTATSSLRPGDEKMDSGSREGDKEGHGSPELQYEISEEHVDL